MHTNAIINRFQKQPPQLPSIQRSMDFRFPWSNSSNENASEDNSRTPQPIPSETPDSADMPIDYDSQYTSSEEYGVSPDASESSLDSFLNDAGTTATERPASHEFTPEPDSMPNLSFTTEQPAAEAESVRELMDTDTMTSEAVTAEAAEPASEKKEEEPVSAPACDDSRQDEAFNQIAGVMDAMFEKIEGFQTTIENLQAQISMLNEELEQKQSVIRNKDMQVERLQKFMTSREKFPLYKMIIEYVDRLTEILESDDKMAETDPDMRHSELLNNVEMFQQAMIGDLENENIFRYRDTEDDPVTFSQGRQTVIDRDESENENEFLRVGAEAYYRSLRPGYTILAPNMAGEETETVLRREEVIKMVFKKN